MNLAIIVGIYSLILGSPSRAPGLIAFNPSVLQAQYDVPGSQPQTAQPQSSESTQAVPSSNSQAQNPPVQVKPSATRRRHRKKAVSNCSDSPAALNPTPGAVSASANSESPASANSTAQGSTDAGSTSASPAPLPPCPPPKKVIRNGGSNEPTVQLKGGTEQAWQQRSTEELTAATSENLKKIARRQLSPSQKEIVNQIKQFMEQSKTAVAAGDVQRGHSLAAKAHLLSDELIKP